MKKLPLDVTPYKKTPVFDEKTIPAGLLYDHKTKNGVWGEIVIMEGELLYIIEGDSYEEILLTKDHYGVVEPGVLHRVEATGDVKFLVQFYS